MKVLYIYDGDWPKGATRVRKETRALAAQGHEVLLVCRNESRSLRRDAEPWMDIFRLPAFRGQTINRLLNFPLFFNPIWVRTILDATLEFRPACLVVEDLPLAPTAIFVGRLRSIPVLYDMGEVYPAFLEGMRRFRKPSITDRVVRSPAAARVVERWVLRRAHHTFVVSKESKVRALELGMAPDRLTIVGNTPEDPESLAESRRRPAALKPLMHRSIVLFVGILIADRGLSKAVEAMTLVKRERPDAVLVIVGDGPERPHLRRLVRALELEDAVHFVGWQPHQDLPGYYQQAGVGLLPFLDGGQIRYTLANKLFDYMGAGLPFVASDVPPMRRIVEESGAGLLATPGDAFDLGGKILEILELDREDWLRMGEAGRRLVRQEYSWEHDARRFVQRVECVVAEAGRA